MFVIEGGLVDAHVHLSFEPHAVFGLARGSRALIAAGLEAHRRRGELLVRDAGALPGIAPEDLAPAIGCGPFLAPADLYLPHLYEPVPPGRAAETAARHIRSGWPWAKVILDYGPPHAPVQGYELSVLKEIASAVHEDGGRLAMHVMGDRVDVAIEAGVDSVEHGNHASPDAVRELAARGIAWVPTLATVAERYLEPAGATAVLDRQRTTLPLAAELGVLVLAGTDEEPHGSVAREVAALIRYGLPPAAAIAGASHAAHAFFGHTPAGRVRFHADPALDPATLNHPIVEAG